MAFSILMISRMVKIFPWGFKAEIFQLLLFLEIFRENHMFLSISARNSVKLYIIFANIDRTTDVFATIFAKYTSTNLYRKNVSFCKKPAKKFTSWNIVHCSVLFTYLPFWSIRTSQHFLSFAKVLQKFSRTYSYFSYIFACREMGS
jgi:hypothetical protein